MVAMDYEVNNIFDIRDWALIARKPYPVRQLKADGGWLIIETGIGKANAAAATQYLIDHYRPARFINLGVVGSLNENITIGEVRKITECRFFDVNVAAFGYQLGQIPKTDVVSYHLGTEIPAHPVRLISGDTFISDSATLGPILTEFPADFIDMELAAIAHVLYRNQSLERLESYKAPSDHANGTAAEDFYANERTAFVHLHAAAAELLSARKLEGAV